MKRKVTAACLFMVVLLSFAAPMHVSGTVRRLGQRYTVNIRVECLTTAVDAMRELPGIDLQMSISQDDAHYLRQVDAAFFRHVQAVLREMGEVQQEHEQVRHLGIELMQLDTRITVLTQEIERLTMLMAASTTIEVLNAVDMQLMRVSRDRDTQLGRRNAILNESQTVLMEITLTERWVPRERINPTFGQRIRDSFVGSWRDLTRISGNLLVRLTRVSLPLFIWLAIAGTVSLTAVKLTKRRNTASMIEPTKGDESHE